VHGCLKGEEGGKVLKTLFIKMQYKTKILDPLIFPKPQGPPSVFPTTVLLWACAKLNLFNSNSKKFFCLFSGARDASRAEGGDLGGFSDPQRVRGRRGQDDLKLQQRNRIAQRTGVLLM
jgi:hypothetical protein